MSVVPRRRRRQGKVVTATYGGVSLTLLIVIAAVALILQPPAPPAVAEFAPSAQERIEDAPDSQSSRFGTGEGGSCAIGQQCEYVAPEEKEDAVSGTVRRRVVDKARVRRCVGDPPRQIEDTQSPPCINFWEGTDNGGATAPGVTRDEIRIVAQAVWGHAALVAEFFNRRFEFYGRRIRIIEVEGSLPYEAERQRALAEKLVTEHRPFAVIGFESDIYDNRPFVEALSRSGVVSMRMAGFTTTDDLERMRPYAWQYWPTVDESLSAFAGFACASLVGRAAEHGNERPLERRAFGVLHEKMEGTAPPVQPFAERLEACGAGKVRVAQGAGGPTSGSWRNIMTEWKVAGVTSVTCVCNFQQQINAVQAASAIGYYPEWLLPGFFTLEEPGVWVLNTSADQRTHVFGLMSDNKYLPKADEFWYRAVKEVDDAEVRSDHYSADYVLYKLFLGVASGIQMAGPRLTPETFERALFATRFPNPGAGEAPYWQARVDFGPRDRTMIADFALTSWDEAANPDGTTPAGWCYIGRGRRWAATAWPQARQPFFDKTQPCR